MLCCAFSEEVDQLGDYLIRVGPGDAVRPVFHHDGSGALDQLRGALSRRIDRQNPVGIAVNHQRGTSTRARSLRKSSCHVATQARLAVAEEPAATFQLA